MIFDINFYVDNINIEVQCGRLRQYQNNSIFLNKYLFQITNKIKYGTDHIFNIRREFDAP